MTIVNRFDFGRLGKAERTPSGGVRVPAHVTRTGVFTYIKEDGTPFRELRHPDEVFDSDSLASLAGAPVTDMHPGKMVSPDNWRDLSIGHVGESVSKKDDKFVAAPLYIQDAKAIAAIERGDRQEISMGYTCRLDMTPGEYNGEKYDAVQRNIRYNHAALGPPKWGRAGSEVSLRLDAAGHSVMPTVKETTVMKTIRIDGRDYEVGSDGHLTKLDEIRTADVAAVQAKLDEAEGKLVVETKRANDAATALTTAQDPTRLDAAVSKRVTLHTKARTILGADAKLDGLSERAVMVRTLTKLDAENPFDEDEDEDKKDGVSIDFIRGMFEAAVKSPPRSDALDKTRVVVEQVTSPAPATKDAPLDKYDAKGAHAQFMQRTVDAWKEPLAASKPS